MTISKQEVEQKVFAAQSADEVAQVMKDAGHEISAEEAAKLFKGAMAAREQDGAQLDQDELDAVAGGRYQLGGVGGPLGGVINWNEYGCAATVEPGSNCWGTDGGCTSVNIKYFNCDFYLKCPEWNGPHTPASSLVKINGEYYFRCSKCGQIYDKDTGNYNG